MEGEAGAADVVLLHHDFKEDALFASAGFTFSFAFLISSVEFKFASRDCQRSK